MSSRQAGAHSHLCHKAPDFLEIVCNEGFFWTAMIAMPGLAKIKERNINKCCSKPVILGNEFHHTNPP